MYFPVTHHIVLQDNGLGGIPYFSETEIPLIMSELNRTFLPAGIQFYMNCVGIDTIYNFSKKNVFLCFLNNYYNLLWKNLLSLPLYQVQKLQKK